MATYAYKCADCSNIFNVHATIQEKEEGKGTKFMCPKCLSKNTKQKFSITHLIKNVFKGDGKANGCCSGNVKKGKSCCD